MTKEIELRMLEDASQALPESMGGAGVTTVVKWKEAYLIGAKAEYTRCQEEIEKLRGLLQEVCVRSGIELPTHECLVDIFDAGFKGEYRLSIALHEALFISNDEMSIPKPFRLFATPDVIHEG